MIPLSALPVIIRGKTLIPRFLYPKHVSLVASLIDFVEEFVDKNITETQLKRLIEGLVGDYRLSRALFYTLKYFYEFRTTGLSDSEIKYLSSRLNISDEWGLKKLFYKWVHEKYGFLEPENRLVALREFATEIGMSLDTIRRVIENELPEKTIFIRKMADKPRPLALIGMYNFLVLEKLLSISDKAVLYVFGEDLGTTVKKLILRAKWHDVLADFKHINKGVEVTITGPHQLFKLPAVSEYGKHIAATIAPVIVTREAWRLRIWVIYRKRRYYCEISGYLRDSPILKPYWVLNPTEKPKETYDSSVEKRLHSILSQVLKRNNARVIRESDVLILSSGRIIIPDLTIIRNGKKVFLEIVGYWRKEYVEKKREKLIEAMRSGFRNFVAVIDHKLRGNFEDTPINKVFYSGDYIPVGKLCRIIDDLLSS
ncbi:MAG: DUF790 family protein [Candidatus Njordarchaeales archaeon]